MKSRTVLITAAVSLAVIVTLFTYSRLNRAPIDEPTENQNQAAQSSEDPPAVEEQASPNPPPPIPNPSSLVIINQAGVDSHAMTEFADSLSAGKWYWEVWLPNICCESNVQRTASIGVTTAAHPTDREMGSGTGSWAWRADGTQATGGRRTLSGSAANKNGDVVMIAFDAENGHLWFGKNGEWFEAGDPAVGQNPSFENLPDQLIPAVSSRHGGIGTAVLDVRTASVSWRHQAPTNFKALTRSTK